MKFYILAVGNKMPDWIKSGYLEYIKRLPPEITVKLIEIKPEKHGNSKQIEQLLSTESQRIQAALPSQCRIVVLDERGLPWTTIEFSKTITRCMNEGGDIVFIIGGSEGLHRDVKQRADEMFALSALTLPHGLVRVLLAEQLYRAISVIKGHPYHRG